MITFPKPLIIIKSIHSSISLQLSKKYYLIESLAIEIADELLKKFDKIIKVAVRVRKNNPPLGGVVDCVEAEVIKDRDELLKQTRK